jgi:hypothetical protein
MAVREEWICISVCTDSCFVRKLFAIIQEVGPCVVVEGESRVVARDNEEQRRTQVGKSTRLHALALSPRLTPTADMVVTLEQVAQNKTYGGTLTKYKTVSARQADGCSL